MTEMTNGQQVSLRFGSQTRSFDTLTGTEGESSIDIKPLLSETGLTTFDPGFGNTASCRSDITYIDGDAGILRYRGYPIEQLATQSSFVEVCYLLIHGELPTSDQLAAFNDELRRHSAVPSGLRLLVDTCPGSGHPMASLSIAASGLAAFHTDNADPEDPDQVETATAQLIAQLPKVAARLYRNSTGKESISSDLSLGYVENFLHMLFGDEDFDQETKELYARAMNLLLILHADHELNCSTATVRVVGSSGANLFASVSAGINALSGPLHGGANQAVLEMLTEIERDGGDVDRFIAKVKDKSSETRLMGFGHRVYKNFDPRSKEIKKLATQILERHGRDDKLFELALKLEEIALNDPYFVDRKLYPNVDFYTGLIYRALGFPSNMFTVLFAIGRLPGWIAHWREQHAESNPRIARPRQLYTGPAKRDYPGHG
ncbi:citrate synthase [Murinocardiopsis flavida]|nr:citrate synthase [Murinocardiopsis flavida]